MEKEANRKVTIIDKEAEDYAEGVLANSEDLQDAIEDAYRAGAIQSLKRAASWLLEQALQSGFNSFRAHALVLKFRRDIENYKA